MIVKIISYQVLNDQIPLSFTLHIIFEGEKEKKSVNVEKQWQKKMRMKSPQKAQDKKNNQKKQQCLKQDVRRCQ